MLWGTLEDGNLVLMRTALASIKESVMIANEFLAYVAVMATVCCAILAIFVSRRITGPILQLTKISKRMAELDFDAKYKPNKRQNEVDELGEHMNMLSATLETTISELKSANNELKKDIEKKEEIDRMRKEFLSNVSHELKTPLALIQGYAEGLQECINDDEESRDFYCEVIMDEADKMNQMVKKLLTLNQLEFGNDTLTMERFDLTELVKGVVTSSGILLKQKDITVTYPEESVYVWADEFKVEEVMTNYLSNAINHAYSIQETRSRRKICRISGTSFTKWIRQEPESTGAVVSGFPSSKRSWSPIIGNVEQRTGKTVWNSGLNWTGIVRITVDKLRKIC